MTDTSTNVPNKSGGEGTPSSLDDIAASMVVTPDADDKSKKSKKTVKEVSEPIIADPSSEIGDDELSSRESAGPLDDNEDVDQHRSTEDEDESILEEEESEELSDEWADFLDEDGSADQGPDTEGEDGEVRPLELTDDLEVSVTVDGEDKKVTLADLKKRYAGEGAIEKRLQEATEARKAALQQQDYNRNKLTQVLNVVGQMLFTPSTKPPDASLKETNPALFLSQVEAYQTEIAALNTRKAQLQKVLEASDQEDKDKLNTFRNEEAVKLRQALPILSDEVRGPKVKAAIVHAAKTYYGFSDADIAAAQDHRLFVMAADAMRYRKMIGKTSKKTTSEIARTIPTKGRNTKPKITANRKRQQAAFAQARKTGSVDDVAATMVVPAKRKGRR